MLRCVATSCASSGWVRPEYRASRLVVTFSMSCDVLPDVVSALADGSSVEGPGGRVGSDTRTDREVGVRADDGGWADLGVVADGVLDDGVVADRAVDEAGVGPDLAAVADHGGALQDRAGIQRDVATDADGDVDERLAGIEHRDPAEQMQPVGARAEFTLGECELPAIVDTLGLVGRCLDDADAMPHRAEHRDHVGEVVLALCVV